MYVRYQMLLWLNGMSPLLGTSRTWFHTCHHSFLCDMTHSCVTTWLSHMWHDSFMCDITHSYVTWLIHVWHYSFMCDTMKHMNEPCQTWMSDARLIRGCDMTDSRHTSETHSSVTWPIDSSHASLRYTRQRLRASRGVHVRFASFMCDTTHSCVVWLIHTRRASFVTHLCVAWLIPTSHASLPRTRQRLRASRGINMWNDSFICDMPHSCETWLIHTRRDSIICDMSHLYTSAPEGFPRENTNPNGRRNEVLSQTPTAWNR